MTRTALAFDYSTVADSIDQWVPEWRQLGFSGVVAVARGGLIAGVMAATALSLPLYALQYRRSSRAVSWFSRATPAPGDRLLLIDDIAGSGSTLIDCRDFLAADFAVELCALVSDDLSRIAPRWSVRLPDGRRAWFPWEREAITAAFAQTDNQPSAPEYRYASWAIDLDGVLLPDLPDEHYANDLSATLARRDTLAPGNPLPPLDLARVTIITGRPEMDRQRTRAWLDRHGFKGPLVMRDTQRFAVELTAEYKAFELHAGGHTHFLESCPRQAIRIARSAPVAKVYWWVGDGSAYLVRASQADLANS
jgi:hypothetical protein